MSPSIVMQLNDSSAASFASRASKGWLTAASVATKPSMVAMLGSIMPAPLLMPVTTMVLPPTLELFEAALATVSVVMMAWAAANQLSPDSAAWQAGSPATMRSTGSGSMMTPVEKGSTWLSESPKQAGDRGAGGARRGQARLAGAGVGDAGVDDQGADGPAR